MNRESPTDKKQKVERSTSHDFDPTGKNTLVFPKNVLRIVKLRIIQPKGTEALRCGYSYPLVLPCSCVIVLLSAGMHDAELSIVDTIAEGEEASL